ncbi:MAG: hypothetical protein AAFR81_27160, partial [Chloroflexota bacterium]
DYYFMAFTKHENKFYELEVMFAFEDYNCKLIDFSASFGSVCSMGKMTKETINLFPRKGQDREQFRIRYRLMMEMFYNLKNARTALIKVIQKFYPEIIV